MSMSLCTVVLLQLLSLHLKEKKITKLDKWKVTVSESSGNFPLLNLKGFFPFFLAFFKQNRLII